MSKDQEHINRSHGQRQRRLNEKVDGLLNGQERMAEVLAQHDEVLAQHDRDIKVMKAQAAMERDQSRK